MAARNKDGEAVPANASSACMWCVYGAIYKCYHSVDQVTMKIYYYEMKIGCGRFSAKSDEEALRRVPKGFLVLYKESDTEDGRPFIIIKENANH